MPSQHSACHSCGMPLNPKTKSKFGDLYCIYCQDQKSAKLKSYEEVRKGSISAAMRLMNKSKAEAIKMADQMLPNLPRWQSKNHSK